MTYRVTLLPHAAKDLDQLEGKLFDQVTAAIAQLADETRPHGCVKLSDEENGYRIRVRDIRILYRINDKAREIIVYRVKHRRESYRR